MKVSRFGPAKGPGTVQPKGKAGKGSEFAKHLLDAVDATDGGQGVEVSQVDAVQSILAVQEVPDATDGRSRGHARRYGDDLLERLDKIRHGLLIGAIPKEDLSELARTMRAERRTSDDRRLNEIIDEIELRAEVEIAKLTRNI